MNARVQVVEPKLTVQDLYALARVDFGVFVELAFPVLHPGKSLIHAPYLDVLVAMMESCAAGRRPRVIVNLPPGFMKSMLISIMYVAWRLGVDPTLKFVCISYGDDLARKHSSSTRKLMQSAFYRAVFPATVLDKKAEDWLSTTKSGYRYATAANSDITGFRPTEIIIDDPMEPEEASSELAKERIRSWVSTSVLTRFEDNQNNVFILVMHRIAPDNLAGTLQKNSGYFTFALPLVAEKSEKFQSWRNVVLMTRQQGDLLNPGRMTHEQLDTLKSEIAPHAYESSTSSGRASEAPACAPLSGWRAMTRRRLLNSSFTAGILAQLSKAMPRFAPNGAWREAPQDATSSTCLMWSR